MSEKRKKDSEAALGREAVSEKAVQYWSQHGWKHGTIVEVGIRPFGKKKTVWVNVADIKAEIA